MNVTLTLDDDLVKRIRRIAAERDTTLTAMIRTYLQDVADEDTVAERKERELDALEDGFRLYSRPMNFADRPWRHVPPEAQVPSKP